MGVARPLPTTSPAEPKASPGASPEELRAVATRAAGVAGAELERVGAAMEATSSSDADMERLAVQAKPKRGQAEPLLPGGVATERSRLEALTLCGLQRS